jgi:prepilin-type N-terminal cleavage/methylation domain-containing protein
MTPSHRIRSEHGFTLVELLLVCVILSVLAGIAYATFGQQDKSALDAQAKANVRNLFSHVQGCFAETGDYTLCDQPTELPQRIGISFGTGPGQVEIRRGSGRTTRTQVTIRGFSKAVTNRTTHRYTFIKRAGPPPDTRTCRAGSGNDAGGCNNGTW